MKEQTVQAKKNRINVQMLFALLFPAYVVTFKDKSIELTKEDEVCVIDNSNYDAFKDIIQQMFCLERVQAEEYKTSGEMANKIADKIRQGKKRVAAQKNQIEGQTETSVLGRYISILSVGEGKDMNTLFGYTVYQLFDEFQRFELKQNYDVYLSAKLAGAKDLKEVDNWMKDIHSIDESNKK